jgi:signal transduction histidine kinase
VLVLNSNRQTVFANKTLKQVLNYKGIEYIGRRPGELFNCKNADLTEGGCGTSEFCRTCGAVTAILRSLDGYSDIQECRITTISGDALDLRVWTNFIDLNNSRFTIFTMWDITDEKRRKMLERIFFHDVLNTAGGIKGFIELLRDADPGEIKEFESIIRALADKLIEEIKAQRELTLAELNELSVNILPCSSHKILDDVYYLYVNHPVANKKELNVLYEKENVSFDSDPLLIRRVLNNMVKNALEAVDEGETVTMTSKTENGTITFSVHNPGVIPKDAQLQIFLRSFSTKGTGRGLGTYSMKLLTERYLKGKIDFTTSVEEGTTFSLTLFSKNIN